MVKGFWIGLLCLFNYSIAYSQLSIQYPVNRMIFQRDNNNQAQINIAGNYSQNVDRIEARVIPVWGGSGSETGWMTIHEFPTTGHFNGIMTVGGGWYVLEIRGVVNGNVVSSARLDRVGVGEVFVVAGQSNAQGNTVYNGATIGASDDRVNIINYYETNLDEEKLPFEFVQMGSSTRMAPYNFVPWFWSRLGDRLAKRLNVPVLFYGAALGGIGSSIWRRSANGEDLRREFPTFIATAGMPYRAMKAALQQYGTRTGIRAVLWQQGESDDLTPEDLYYDNIKTVINKSRSDSQFPILSWVMARSSRNPDVHPSVLSAQTRLIKELFYVFPGPETDLITGPAYRSDGIHFHEEGLVQVAEQWSNYLDDGFFNNSRPLLSKPLLRVAINCNSSNNFTVAAQAGFSKYTWSTGQTSSSISAASGFFKVKAQDAVGNTFFAQPILISNQNQVSTPTITVNGSNTICDGSSVTLSSNVSNGNLWSNGAKGQNIQVSSGGTYSVVNYSINGCVSSESNRVSINVVPSPQTSITPNKFGAFCPDDSLILTGNNLNDNVTFKWNTGSTQRQIIVKQGGVYSLAVRGQNGCERIAYYNAEQRNRPQPILYTDKPMPLCAGENLLLYADKEYADYQWSTGEKTKDIFVRTSGDYFLKVRDNFGCFSENVKKPVYFQKLPQTKIVAEGVDKFCPGNQVRLFSGLQTMRYFWNTGNNSQEIYVSQPGTYSLRVADELGCVSLTDSIVLKYIPLPVAEITSDNGTFGYCQGSSLTLTSKPAVTYYWNTGETANKITVNRPGTYSLKIKDEKGCTSNFTNVEVSEKATPATPIISQSGTYELEASGTDNQIFQWKFENNLLEPKTKNIKVIDNGNYSSRAGNIYTINDKALVCYSPYSTNFNFLLPLRDKGLSVYPNPVRDSNILVEIRPNLTNATLNVVSTAGQIVYQTTYAEFSTKKKLELPKLSAGIYVLQVIGTDFYASTKLFVE